VNLGVDRTLCRGSSVSLNAGNAGSSFTWSSSNPGFTSNTQIITVVDTGKYWVNVSSAIGCNASDTIQIRLDDNYVVAHFLCASSSFVGDTLVFINLSYPNPQAYEWNFSDGIVTSETNPTHIFYTSNNFPVSLTATKLNCTDTLVKNINIQPRLSEQKDSVIQFMGIEITEAIVYPNPSSGIFNLKVDLNFNSDISLRIFDLQGKLLTYKSIRANTYLEEFNLNKLGAEDGIYLIDIIAGKARKTLRLIKTQ
jgi:PKD repeat protein